MHHHLPALMKNDSLTVFNFGEHEVRVTGTQEAPLFCVADVCEVLDIGNSRSAIENHPADEKGVGSFDTPGGEQKLQVVTEPGLYRLIFRSYKPKAEEFRKWVFREVLPALRRTGQYAIPGRVDAGNPELESRASTFLRVTEYLVGKGMEPVDAGNAAIYWMPVLTTGRQLRSLPSTESRPDLVALIDKATWLHDGMPCSAWEAPRNAHAVNQNGAGVPVWTITAAALKDALCSPACSVSREASQIFKDWRPERLLRVADASRVNPFRTNKARLWRIHKA